MSRLKAVILVGGFGTRLRPLTDNMPKPMLPVVNRPFMEHTIAHLKTCGIEDIVLAMSYLPEAIKAYFGDGRRCGVKLTYCLEEEPLGTAGAVKNAEVHLKGGPFIVLNGDNVFFELDAAAIRSFHRVKRAAATIFLTWVENPSAFGVVERDREQRVLRFVEKPPPGQATTNWINAGGYLLEPEVLDEIPAGQYYMFEKGLFPKLLETGRPVYGYEYQGYWLDMGTPEKYFTLNMDLAAGRAASPLLRENVGGDIYYGSDGAIPSGAVVRGPAVIGRDCRLENGARLENAVIWDGVTLAAGSTVSHSIVANGVVINSGQNVTDSVVTRERTVPLGKT